METARGGVGGRTQLKNNVVVVVAVVVVDDVEGAPRSAGGQFWRCSTTSPVDDKR